MFAIRLANELAQTQNVFFIELYPGRTREKRQLSLLDKKRVTFFQPENSKGKGLASKISSKLALAKVKTRASENTILDQQIISFLKKNKIAVVNSHSWDSDVYFAGLKSRMGFKLVSTFHGHYDFVADKRLNYDSRTAATLSCTDEVIYTSPQHVTTLDSFSYPAERRHKIFYGVSMPLSNTVTKYNIGECLHLVMAARGIKEKGWEEAILAVLQLSKKYPDLLKLSLLGEGPYLDCLKKKYSNPSIQFLGYQNNVTEIVREAHIGILLTYFVAESLPNT